MKTFHIIGSGMAGLSAAVSAAAAGGQVVVYEAAGHAGGRCRTYRDATLDMEIDNGNHLVLSGNPAVQDYLALIGAPDALTGPDTAEFSFCEVKDNTRWTLRPGNGALPLWIFDPARRVPGTGPIDYLKLGALLMAGPEATIGDLIPCHGPLWENLMRPLLLAVMNTEPEKSSARLAAAVLKETMAKGGKAYRPRIATPNLGAAFVDPAVAYLSAQNAFLHFGQRLRKLVCEGSRVTALEFPENTVAIGPDDAVILAVPAWVAETLIPGLTVPNEYRAIANAHFKLTPPPGAPAMLGLTGGMAEWIFTFPDRISVTISAADWLADKDREELARSVWGNICTALNIDAVLPSWQVVREKRATFAATPAQDARRPEARTAWSNLILAGDWTKTHLPATIEGALRSGFKAARLAGANITADYAK